MWSKKLSFVLIAASLLYSDQGSCEYRVYQYYVKSRFFLPQDSKAYLVTSTLDPVSYLSYHGGSESIKIDLVRSWECKGHTGEERDFCSAPLESSLPAEPIE